MSWVNDVIPQIPSIVSAAAAAAAAYAAGRSARLAGQQVTNQQAQFEASMQPYVWVDIRPRDEDGQLYWWWVIQDLPWRPTCGFGWMRMSHTLLGIGSTSSGHLTVSIPVTHRCLQGAATPGDSGPLWKS